MTIIHIPNGRKIICVKATSFPDGVMDGHRKLHCLITHDKPRRYYSVSHGSENGLILYMAGAEIVEDADHGLADTEEFTIRKGDYISKEIQGYMENIPAIGETFAEMLKRPDIDPQGYCLEHYLDQKTVVCMVPLMNE